MLKDASYEYVLVLRMLAVLPLEYASLWQRELFFEKKAILIIQSKTSTEQGKENLEASFLEAAFHRGKILQITWEFSETQKNKLIISVLKKH